MTHDDKKSFNQILSNTDHIFVMSDKLYSIVNIPSLHGKYSSQDHLGSTLPEMFHKINVEGET
jgi:hypothetical protein